MPKSRSKSSKFFSTAVSLSLEIDWKWIICFIYDDSPVSNNLRSWCGGILHLVCCVFKDCSQRWDVIKQRAMEKRRRLKHNYQLWNQFLKDVTELRHWIVQYSPTYPTSGHFKDPSIELRAPEDVGLEQFKRFMAVSKERSPMYHVKKRTLRLNSLEELIRSHTVRIELFAHFASSDWIELQIRISRLAHPAIAFTDIQQSSNYAH